MHYCTHWWASDYVGEGVYPTKSSKVIEIRWLVYDLVTLRYILE